MPTVVVSTIGPGKTYANFPAWVAARKGDLVARDTVEVAELYAGGSLGELLLAAADWTADATRYVEIRPGPGQGHPGVYDNSKVFLQGVTDNPFWIQVGFTKVRPGITIFSNVDTPEIAGFPHAVLLSHIPADAPCEIDGVIARVGNGGMAFRAEYCNVDTDHVFRNCLAMKTGGGSSTAFRATNASILVVHCAALGMDNCVFADNDEGGFGEPAAPGKVTTENCYLNGDVVYAAPVGPGSSVVKGAKDVTSNAEATDAALRNVSAALAGHLGTAAGFEDPHLSSAGFLRGKGAATTALADMDGHVRPATSPDVGPLQFTVPATVVSRVGPGGDYATWADWVAARQGNLAERDTVEDVHIMDLETVGARLETKDWGVNLKNFIRLRAADAFGHKGAWNSARVHFKNAAGTRDAFFCGVSGTVIGPGLQFENSFYSGSDPRCVQFQDCIRAPLVVEGVLLKNAVIKDDCRLVWAENCGYDPVRPHRIRNSAGWTAGGNTAARGFRLNGTWKVHNDVLLVFGSSSIAIEADGGTTDVQNCYLASTLCYSQSGGGTINKGANDATENGEALTPAFRNLFRTSALKDGLPVGYPDTAPDFHQKEGGIPIGAGADLTAEGVVGDFEGHLRLAPFDIGCDEQYDFRAGVTAWTVPKGGKRWAVPAAGKVWVVPADLNIEEDA